MCGSEYLEAVCFAALMLMMDTGVDCFCGSQCVRSVKLTTFIDLVPSETLSSEVCVCGERQSADIRM
jgi:hypothetical protein